MAQHLSIRIPWKDNGYDGLICEKPCFNNACLRLKNIVENRDDELEESLKGCPIIGHEAEIPCLAEGACFMANYDHKIIVEHPYKKSNPETHGHFLPTEIVYKANSVPVRPYRWLMLQRSEEKDNANIEKFISRYGINFDYEIEPRLPFKTSWIQDAENQRQIFDKFYRDVELNKSLMVAYAKQVPFLEDPARVVIGIGYITGLTLPREYEHTNEGTFKSMLWETMAEHSIRSTRENGFLLPYKEMVEYSKLHPDFDINSIVVTSDPEFFEEFSYASEHLSYDAVISVLNKTIKALEIIKGCIPGNWEECIKWAKDRLIEVWSDRGPFPGLGSMFRAMGFSCGHLMAREIKLLIEDNSQYVSITQKALASPREYFSEEINNKIGATEAKAFLSLSGDREALFWLLARISLTDEQAEYVFNLDDNSRSMMICSTEEIVKNPYILYEKSRLLKASLQIPVSRIDMAVFPPEIINKCAPLQEPTALVSDNDQRRIRALSVNILEQEADKGHTVYPQSDLVRDINNLPVEPGCHVTGDIINSIMDFLKGEMLCVSCVDGSNAFQLKRIQEIDDLIRRTVNRRTKAAKHDIQEDWNRIYDNAFPDDSENERKKYAKQEKIAALEELSKSRLSVLIGGAGTGKTTLLALLCKSKQIFDGGVLLLAPTGKARVRMSQAMDEHNISHTAMTVAQFLIRNNRFDWNTMRYRLSNDTAMDVPFTVIIDESSMLTEEMFGALLQALKPAQRIIFVGDPNQLPPIGAGRPFVDLVRYLEPKEATFPFVSGGYAKLTITMRQFSEDGESRGDTALAQWYSDETDGLDDSIFIELQSGKLGDHVVFKQWETPEELQKQIFETIKEENNMDNIDDIEGFDISIGGSISNGWMNFGDNPKLIDAWQILSAYRSDMSIGTGTINRYIHEKYRSQACVSLANCKRRGTKHLLGIDGVVYGDKVINVRNHHHFIDGYPSKKGDGFVANGEVGIVERIFEKPKQKTNSHKIRFSSQPDMSYNWYSSIGEEGNSDIELAYALTVHKSQGSEFNKIILVLGDQGPLLSKELLYTAITRQKDKLIILYNNPAFKLRDYTFSSASEVARRYTCLFKSPDPVEYKGKYYEKSLIHKTEKGYLVRSKSEVIISNMLYERGIDHEYEKELDLGEDGKRIPDFTIEDQEMGITYYWEHLGMLTDDKYRRDWEIKKSLYAKHGITEGNNLIVTKDEPNGSIDSLLIKELIEKYLM